MVVSLAAGCDGGADQPLASAVVSSSPAPMVVVLGIDGLDPETVKQLSSEGRLPHLSRLMREGAAGILRAEPPLLSPILWTTIATGRPAREHGIAHFVATDPITGEEMPVTSDLRRTQAIWNMVSGSGQEVAVVGWWATWPAEEIRGTVVTDHAGYHFMFPQAGGSLAKDGAIAPPAEAQRLSPLMRAPDSVTRDELQDFASLAAGEGELPFDFADPVSHLKWAYVTADSYRRITLDLIERRTPRLVMAYFEATDSVSHLFGHLYGVEGLAGDLLEEQRRFGDVIPSMYEFADRIVGEVRAAMPEGSTLLVLSDHGFHLGQLHQDPTAMRRGRIEVDDAMHHPEGLIVLHGEQIVPGVRLESATHLDITPTVLELLGLDVALDLPGRVLEETLISPIAPRTLPTYEVRREPSVARPSHQVAERSRERLEALGYLDPKPPRSTTPAHQPTGGHDREARSSQSDLNLAALAVQEGRYRDAIAAYRRLLRDRPDEVRLYVSLAVAYAGEGQFDRAESALAEALERSPSNSRAHYNRGMVAELQGRLDEAASSYRTALEYEPAFEVARQALMRLGHDTGAAMTPAESEAMALCERARDLAMRGDYEAAWRVVERALDRAPRSATVLQYRSNIAYLRGDPEAAIASLEAALEIEPANLLFRKNLAALRSEANAKIGASAER